MTGSTYTLVFLDTGNHQPVVSPESMFLSPPVSSEAKAEVPVKPQSVAQERSSSALDQLAQLDLQIESTANAEAAKPAGPRQQRKSTIVPSTAPLPPPPPPPPALSSGLARAKSRVELAAQLLGVSPPPAAAGEAAPEEANVSGPYFGIELRDLYVRDGTAVPKVLIAAAEELRKRAHVEGIFRIPGRANNVAAMVDAADRGQPIDLQKAETPEIASFLKKFFALLPSSVIPPDLVDRFGKAHADSRSLCMELRQLMDQALPPERAEVLSFTLELLNYIAERSDKNKMTSKNLATVFLPALFFSVQGDATSPEEIMKMAVLGKGISQTLSFMIDNPKLDPARALERELSFGAATIPAGGSGSSSAGSSAANSPQVTRMGRSGSHKGPSSQGGGGGALKGSGSHKGAASQGSSPVQGLKTAARRRSATLPEKDVLTAVSSSPDGKLSAESVLAAMRKARVRLS